MAIDLSGNLYIATSESTGAFGGTIRKISPGGVISTLAGTAGRRTPPAGINTRDGTGPAATFGSIDAIAVSDNGIIFVSEERAIRRVTPEGVVTTVLAANAPNASIFRGLAVAKSGELIVSDYSKHAIYRMDPFTGAIALIAGGNQGGRINSYTDDFTGDGAAAKFSFPHGISIDHGKSLIYVADWGNSCVRTVTFAGKTGVLYPEVQFGTFANPSWVSVDANGTAYFGSGSSYGDRIFWGSSNLPLAKLDLTYPDEYLRQGSRLGFDYRFKNFVIGKTGDIYIADAGNHVILKGRLSSEPVPTVFIPGIAGSELVEETAEGRQRTLWPTVSPDNLSALALRIGIINGQLILPRNIKAVDIVQSFVPLLKTPIHIYKPFIDYFTDAGYVYHDIKNSTTGFNLISVEPGKPKPTLFPFPYDWRLGNAGHINALARYIQAISEFHGGKKVNLIAHSMGGMVARRYLIEHGATYVDKMITVGTPFLGTPMAVERIFNGDFYNNAVDWWANDTILDILPTFPSVYELLPSTTYLNGIQQMGDYVFYDKSTERPLNQNEFRALIDERIMSARVRLTGTAPGSGLVPIFKGKPYEYNDEFHGFRNAAGMSQDDASRDNRDFQHLLIHGRRLPQDTAGAPVKFRGRTRADSLGREYPDVEVIRGAGDHVVAEYSAIRFGVNSPRTQINTLSGFRPIDLVVAGVGADDAEHTGMMASTDALYWMKSFLETGATPLLSREGSEALAENAPRVTTVVEILGTGFSRVRDSKGNENLKLSDVAAARVPGVNIVYNSSQRMMSATFDSNKSLTFEGDNLADHIELDVTEYDSTNVIKARRRFRIDTGLRKWRMVYSGTTLAPDFRLDRNADDVFSDAEVIKPNVSITAGVVDVEPPTISAVQKRVANSIEVTLSSTDNSGSSTIYYNIGGLPKVKYANPFNVQVLPQLDLRAFAEDAAGNISRVLTARVGDNLESQARLTNLSVRTSAGNGDQSLIVGFSISSPGTKKVLIRSVGPGLSQFGVSGFLPDPQVKLYSSDKLIGENNDWVDDAAIANTFTKLGAFALPASSRDAALFLDLGSGSYTAVTNGTGASTGVVLVEAYEADGSLAPARLTNVSARNHVGTGENILIVGINISGSSAKNLLIRAIGPSLAAFGVTGTLSDPRLRIFSGTQLLNENDNWGGTASLTSAFGSVGAFSLSKEDSRDSAMILALHPGSYTIQVDGINSATGIALAEIYELP